MNELIKSARLLAGREAAYREAYAVCGPTSAEANRRRKVMAQAGDSVRAALLRKHAEDAKRIGELVEAGSALIADVRRRYPGEELRCEFMRNLDAALNGANGNG